MEKTRPPAADTLTIQANERRGTDRAEECAGWEAKVLGRLSGRLRDLPRAPDGAGQIGWETSVLDVLRRRIERTE